MASSLIPIARSRVQQYRANRRSAPGNVVGENYDAVRSLSNLRLNPLSKVGDFGAQYMGPGIAAQDLLIRAIPHRAQLKDIGKRHEFTLAQTKQTMDEAYDQQKANNEADLKRARDENERGLLASWLGAGAGAAANFIPGIGPAVAPFVNKGVTMLAS